MHVRSMLFVFACMVYLCVSFFILVVVIFVFGDGFVSSAEFFVSVDGFVPTVDEATVALGASYFSDWLRRTSMATHPRVVPLLCAGPSFYLFP